MRETSDEVRDLQLTLDRSDAAAGEHLRSIFDDRHRCAAEDVIETLDAIFEMHLATVSADGAPLVAPVDGIFFKGCVWFGLPAGSVRARHLRRDPRVSASYAAGSFAIVVHGTARAASESGALFAEYDEVMRRLYVATYGPAWNEWYDAQVEAAAPGDGFIGWIEPRRMFAKR